MVSGLNMSRRIRRTPYTHRTEDAGVHDFTVVNHMLLPKAYGRSVEEDYRHLREAVQVWDVSCERQVQIEGPDAARLVQMMTPRNIGGARVGDCLYLPLTDPDGGIVNDPVLLKLADDRFFGMAKLCTLDGSIDFIGREALDRIARGGVTRIMRGVAFDGPPGPVCATPWPITADGRIVGRITSAAWSPRLKRNVGLSLIDREFWGPGQPVEVGTPDGTNRPGEVSALPFA